MLLPNKIISVKESSIYKATILLSKLNDRVTVDCLYESSKSNFSDVTDFIDALLLLFTLNKIDYDYDKGEIISVI